jgi:4-amino-4-deoxy-L-arabinose transferase-like glycosyltransferase
LLQAALIAFTINPSTYLWWDECMNLLTAKQVLADPLSFNEYGVIGWHLESYRPHLLPWLLALLGGSQEAGIWLVALSALAATLALFLLARDEFGADAGLLAGIVAVGFFDYALYSVRLYNDMPGLALSLLALYSMRRKRAWLSGALYGLAFIARYTSAMMALPLAYLLLEEAREGGGLKGIARPAAGFAAFAAAAASLQLLLSDTLVYGVPFASIPIQLMIISDSPGVGEQFYYLGRLAAQNPAASLAFLAGLLLALKERRLLMPVFFASALAMLELSVTHKEPRYLVYFIPPFAALAGFGAARAASALASLGRRAPWGALPGRAAGALLLASFAALMLWTAWGTAQEVRWLNWGETAINSFIMGLAERAEGKVVATNEFAPIACHSNATVYALPVEEGAFREVAAKVDYIIFVYSPAANVDATSMHIERLNESADAFEKDEYYWTRGHNEYAMIYRKAGLPG